MRSVSMPLVLCLSPLLACGKSSPPSPAPSAAPSVVSESAPASATARPDHAELGKPAPDFSLTGIDGNKVSLRDFQGKTVVLEWFNPECPFVRMSHTKGSLKSFPATQTAKGVVWLAINSGAPGKQGNGVEKNVEGTKRYGMTYPVLLDETGEVGKLYGATNTPHMFVVDPKGVLVYRGAIDNSPDGEGESPQGGKLVNHVEAALADLGAGKAPSVADTKAYGCGVKY